MAKKPLIIGISGGSGSGKTTASILLSQQLGKDQTQILYQDRYYRDQSHLFDHDGGNINYDHPSAIDFKLMAQHLDALSRNEDIQVPRYDFTTHTRLPKTDLIHPKSFIIVDGILIFSEKIIRERLDYRIFVDVPEDVRFEREDASGCPGTWALNGGGEEAVGDPG